MRKLIMLLAVLAMAASANAKHCKVNKANETHHTVQASARPFKAVGKGLKGVVTGVVRVVDAAVVDPVGVGLQMLADGLDMSVAAPLEALPEPFEAVGDGVHVVYKGLDKVGVQLAK